MDEDVDFSGWELPPVEDDPDREPPPDRETWGGISIHHLRFPEGDTSAENLGPGCRRDHRLKHQAGWQVRRNPERDHDLDQPARPRIHQPSTRPLESPRRIVLRYRSTSSAMPASNALMPSACSSHAATVADAISRTWMKSHRCPPRSSKQRTTC